MKFIKSGLLLLMSAGLAFVLSGCSASSQARKVELKEATLVNSDLYKEGTDGQALYRYVNPKADFKQFSKVLIDPVLVKKDGQLDNEEFENYQKLANNAYVYLTKELEKSYTLVKSPEPGAIRLQMAIIEADSASQVRMVTSSLLPIGIAASLVKYSATGKASAVGEITVEMRLTDATTGELLAAALDRRVGGKDWGSVTNKWYSADEALKYWAGRVSYALCDAKGGGVKCVKPVEK